MPGPPPEMNSWLAEMAAELSLVHGDLDTLKGQLLHDADVRRIANECVTNGLQSVQTGMANSIRAASDLKAEMTNTCLRMDEGLRALEATQKIEMLKTQALELSIRESSQGDRLQRLEVRLNEAVSNTQEMGRLNREILQRHEANVSSELDARIASNCLRLQEGLHHVEATQKTQMLAIQAIELSVQESVKGDRLQRFELQLTETVRTEVEHNFSRQEETLRGIKEAQRVMVQGLESSAEGAIQKAMVKEAALLEQRLQVVETGINANVEAVAKADVARSAKHEEHLQSLEKNQQSQRLEIEALGSSVQKAMTHSITLAAGAPAASGATAPVVPTAPPAPAPPTPQPPQPPPAPSAPPPVAPAAVAPAVPDAPVATEAALRDVQVLDASTVHAIQKVVAKEAASLEQRLQSVEAGINANISASVSATTQVARSASHEQRLQLLSEVQESQRLEMAALERSMQQALNTSIAGEVALREDRLQQVELCMGANLESVVANEVSKNCDLLDAKVDRCHDSVEAAEERWSGLLESAESRYVARFDVSAAVEADRQDRAFHALRSNAQANELLGQLLEEQCVANANHVAEVRAEAQELRTRDAGLWRFFEECQTHNSQHSQAKLLAEALGPLHESIDELRSGLKTHTHELQFDRPRPVASKPVPVGPAASAIRSLSMAATNLAPAQPCMGEAVGYK